MDEVDDVREYVLNDVGIARLCLGVNAAKFHLGLFATLSQVLWRKCRI